MNAGGTGGPSFGRGGGRRRWNDSANAATNGGGTREFCFSAFVASPII